MRAKQYAAVVSVLLLAFMAAGCKTESPILLTYPDGGMPPGKAAILDVQATDRAVTLLYVDFHKVRRDARQVCIIPGYHQLVFRVGNHQNPLEDITVPYVFISGRHYQFRLGEKFVQGRPNPEILEVK